MIINCDYCNKEFNKKPSQIKRSKNHFCSKDCHNKWMDGKTYPERSTKVTHNCHQCGESITVPNYKFERFLKGEIKDLFCDKDCSARWKSVHFKGEKSTKYNSIETNCEFCGTVYIVPKSRENTSKYCSNDCHSKDRIENIEVICDYCEITFTKKRAMIRNNNFCNRECSAQWNSENNKRQVAIACFICDKEFNVHRSRAESAKSCSKKCHYIWLKEYYFKSDKGRQHLINNGVKSQLNQNYSDTKPERIMKEYLIHNNIEFIPQHPMYDKFVVDFYLPKEDAVIEVFGDYWHGNPLFYGESEKTKPLSEKQIRQKKKDKSRQAYLEKCGHSFHILWENDIYHNLAEITKFL